MGCGIAAQQCANLGERYLEVDRRLADPSVWNLIFHGKEDQLYSNEDVIAFGKVIEEGFSVLAEVQKRLVDNPTSALPKVGFLSRHKFLLCGMG